MAASGSNSRTIEPESIRHMVGELVQKVTRPGYHGAFTLTVQVRDGAIYAADKELKETIRA